MSLSLAWMMSRLLCDGAAGVLPNKREGFCCPACPFEYLRFWSVSFCYSFSITSVGGRVYVPLPHHPHPRSATKQPGVRSEAWHVGSVERGAGPESLQARLAFAWEKGDTNNQLNGFDNGSGPPTLECLRHGLFVPTRLRRCSSPFVSCRALPRMMDYERGLSEDIGLETGWIFRHNHTSHEARRRR